MLYSELWAVNRFVGSESSKHNAFNQFWKFNLHFEHFLRNTQFLSFGGPTNYLYLFKNHRQVFSWPEERPPPHLKVTKMWFGPNIKYFLEPFFADFCCRRGISCWPYNQFNSGCRSGCIFTAAKAKTSKQKQASLNKLHKIWHHDRGANMLIGFIRLMEVAVKHA